MKRWLSVFVVTASVAMMIVPSRSQGQTVNRVVSQYFRWNGSESSTQTPLTKVIYSHTFFVPTLSTGGPKYNVAYFSLHLFGDASCAAPSGVPFCKSNQGLACTIDGTLNANACPIGAANTAASGGLPYVIFNGTVDPGSTGETNMSYTWCVPIKTAGTHTFRLFLGSFNVKASSSQAFAEAGMVNIDLATLPSASACTAAPNL